MATEVTHCPQCGAVLPSDAPAGHCPGCLLKLGVEGDPSREQVGATVDSPAPDDSAGGFPPPSLAELAERFPQLEILELLGHGGMGAVYKARQPKLDRYVALKILPPQLGHDPAFAERFSREAQTLARLNHPNIVTVYDFGDVDGLFYFVMEYVDGVNLRQSMHAKKLTAAEALAIVPQICDALQFAHEEGVVHRDIKPENVMLDTKGRVKIADFGLAKLVGRSASARQLTISHQVMGTMHYMAPEQMEKPLEVDHRADIYSLGVVFYELLTGELPFGRFDPPSAKAPVNAELDKIVLRALEKELDRRYQRASDVKTDVDRISGREAAGPQNAGTPTATPKLVSAPAALTLDGEAMGSGVARFDGVCLTLEFELDEDDAAWFEGSTPGYGKPCEPGCREVSVPLNDIAAAEFKSGWFGGQLRITTHTVRAVADVPGSDQASVVLAVTKDNARLARQLVAAMERSLGREHPVGTRRRPRKRDSSEDTTTSDGLATAALSILFFASVFGVANPMMPWSEVHLEVLPAGIERFGLQAAGEEANGAEWKRTFEARGLDYFLPVFAAILSVVLFVVTLIKTLTGGFPSVPRAVLAAATGIAFATTGLLMLWLAPMPNLGDEYSSVLRQFGHSFTDSAYAMRELQIMEVQNLVDLRVTPEQPGCFLALGIGAALITASVLEMRSVIASTPRSPEDAVQGPATALRWAAWSSPAMIPVAFFVAILYHTQNKSTGGMSAMQSLLIAATMLQIVHAAVCAPLILRGAARLRNMSSRRWSLTASILPMLPLGWSWMIGLPVGIWSLVVLYRPDVHSAFRRGMPPRRAAVDKPLPESDRQRILRMLHGPSIGLFVVALVSALPVVLAIAAFVLRFVLGSSPEPSIFEKF